jgi:hypothetical protein
MADGLATKWTYAYALGVVLSWSPLNGFLAGMGNGSSSCLIFACPGRSPFLPCVSHSNRVGIRKFMLRTTAPRTFVPAVICLATCENTILELVGQKMETVQELFHYDR